MSFLWPELSVKHQDEYNVYQGYKTIFGTKLSFPLLGTLFQSTIASQSIQNALLPPLTPC